jgi:hypothetical protein
MLGDSFVLRNRQLHEPAKRWLHFVKETYLTKKINKIFFLLLCTNE